jgi:hypothetical protein
LDKIDVNMLRILFLPLANKNVPAYYQNHAGTEAAAAGCFGGRLLAPSSPESM